MEDAGSAKRHTSPEQGSGKKKKTKLVDIELENAPYDGKHDTVRQVTVARMGHRGQLPSLSLDVSANSEC